MNERMVWMNGELVAASEAKVSIYDVGFTGGDAAQDGFRTYRHRPLLRDRHFDRFFRTAAYLGIDPGMSRHELGEIVDLVLETNLPLISKDEEFQVGLRCTRGADHRTDMRTNVRRPTIIVGVSTFRVDAPSYTSGVDVVTVAVRRTPRQAIHPAGKTQNKLNGILADLEARITSPHARNLMLDMEGRVAEGSHYNYGAVVDGTLISPKGNCLEGITMQLVIELANRIGLPARFADLSLEDLYRSSEAFVTGSSYVMLPVRSVDGRRIGTALPGPTQEAIWAEWDRMVGLDVREQARRYLNAYAGAVQVPAS